MIWPLANSKKTLRGVDEQVEILKYLFFCFCCWHLMHATAIRHGNYAFCQMNQLSSSVLIYWQETKRNFVQKSTTRPKNESCCSQLHATWLDIREEEEEEATTVVVCFLSKTIGIPCSWVTIQFTLHYRVWKNQRRDLLNLESNNHAS
jgi:hypothetical protein